MKRIHKYFIIIWLHLIWTAIKRRWVAATDEEQLSCGYWAAWFLIVFVLLVWGATMAAK